MSLSTNLVQIPKVAVLTVTYGTRWNYLSQVMKAVIDDPHVVQVVIVDNGSSNQQDIIDGTKEYGERVVVLRSEKNLGSAGGFAKGLDHVRSINCEYVFTLDDDNVPEEGAVGIFLEHMQYFMPAKVALVGNRINIPGNQEVYFSDEKRETKPKGTFFESISFKKIRHFISLFVGKELQHKRLRSVPHEYVANESFIYGGAFIPIDAVKRAPLPDAALVLYGDDIEYSWGIKRLGYDSYVCYSPKIRDIDMSFGEGSQAIGVLDPKTKDFRTYYRIRNLIIISRRNTSQIKLVLFVNICIWLAGLIVLGGIRYGMHKGFLKKVQLVLQASWAGYFPHTKVPTSAHLPQ